MSSRVCDHCGAPITIDFKPTDPAIFWCSDCILNGGRELLRSYKVHLQLDDKTYLKNGYAYWWLDESDPNSWGIKVSKIPKKNAPPQPAIEIVQQSLDLAQEAVHEVVVCPKAYYGTPPCLCGSCPDRNYVPNKNVFGY